MNRKAIWEGLKEVGRIAFLAAVTAAIAWATDAVDLLDPTSTFYIVGTLVLRFADKYLHENQDVKISGIAPF